VAADEDKIAKTVQQVQEVFSQLDAHIGQFQTATGLHCKWGCGKCCFKPDIEATILEFLPYAHFLYQHQLAIEKLEELKSGTDVICTVLNPTQAGAGLCSEYEHRGLICRLFGYSARTTKYGEKELVTCQIIKTEQQALYAAAQQKIAEGQAVPVMSHYYMQLHAIDFQLAKDFYPINVAISKAIETVLHYYAYR
jgi:Fe-S-cluster containining protein